MSVISKRAIIEASLQLIDNEGTQALTMRKLAAQLNIEAPSLYYYVKNKNQLCQLIVDTLVARSVVSAPVAATANESIQNVARTYHTILRSHPGAIALAAAYPVQLATVSDYVASIQTLKKNDAQVSFTMLSVFAFVAAHALAQLHDTANESRTFYDQWFAYGVSALTMSFSQ